ncbi:MAG: hypothetical protein ACR2IF_06015 [Terriglobales bacterium]
MRPIKVIIGIAVLAIGISTGWRVGSGEVANIELQSDMRDLASQSRNYIRYTPPRSDDDFRDAVIHMAKEHGIELDPTQVTVERPSPGTMYLAADYRLPVELPWFSFVMHFTPSSEKDSF